MTTKLKKLIPFPLVLLCLFFGCRMLCKRVPKPALNEDGPVAYLVDEKLQPPEFHNPADWWRMHHPKEINADIFNRRTCARCHEAEKHCNRCHSYIGAKAQTLPGDVPRLVWK